MNSHIHFIYIFGGYFRYSREELVSRQCSSRQFCLNGVPDLKSFLYIGFNCLFVKVCVCKSGKESIKNKSICCFFIKAGFPCLHVIERDTFKDIDQPVLQICNFPFFAAYPVLSTAFYVKCFLTLITEHTISPQNYFQVNFCFPFTLNFSMCFLYLYYLQT
ncbi:hypothetical protein SDC9_184033 [bioreactor metagenome]|uniref:Uncharacterized protein n=1 Tax=bioreactor metagenome TaxID=1076179 RepID=A0A645HK64_9ZZZZ